jgi:hypothetical protein
MRGGPALATILLTNAGTLPARRQEAVVSMVRRAVGKRESISVAGHRGMTLRVTHGQVWLTRDGDMKDHVLSSGDSMALTAAGLVVLFGLTEASLQIDTPARARGVWSGLIARFI